MGPLARSAHDCAIMLGLVAGEDAADRSSARAPVPDYVASLNGSVAGLRVGVEFAYHTWVPDVDPSTRRSFGDAVDVLRDAGAKITEVTIEHHKVITDATWVVLLSEAFAYHRRELQAQWSDYGAPTRAALASGALYSAADYVQAQRVRAMALERMWELFNSCDVVVMPTTAGGALSPDSDLDTVVSWILTPVWSAVGFPTLAIPVGATSSGLPLSMQVVGKPFADALVLRVGDAYQRLTDWHLRLPPTITTPGSEAS